jgi:transposase-like protein
MAARAPKQRAPRRRWPPAEKRRLVELTLQPGSSLGAIARGHGVYPNSLRQWKALYVAGKLDAQQQLASSPDIDAPAASATFLPVSLIRPVPKVWARIEMPPGPRIKMPPPGSVDFRAAQPDDLGFIRPAGDGL